MRRNSTGDRQTMSGEAHDETSLVGDALSHPLRVRILGWLRHQPARTQSEVGKALALSNATARYHLKVLEGADLVTLQGTRPGPNGITEKLYAYNPEVWKLISEEPDRAQKQDFMLDYTFALVHEIHRKAVDIIKVDWRPAFLAGSVGAFATLAEIQAFKAEIESLSERFYKDHNDPERPDTIPVAITFAVLPASKDDAQAAAEGCVFEWSGNQ
jgi:DNA-binding transcriptional ArsR family regulator